MQWSVEVMKRASEEVCVLHQECSCAMCRSVERKLSNKNAKSPRSCSCCDVDLLCGVGERAFIVCWVGERVPTCCEIGERAPTCCGVACVRPLGETASGAEVHRAVSRVNSIHSCFKVALSWHSSYTCGFPLRIARYYFERHILMEKARIEVE